MPIELDHTDIDVLRRIQAGQLKLVEARQALRLMLMGYLAPLEEGCAALAPAQTVRQGRTQPLRITYGGICLLARARRDELPAGHAGAQGERRLG